MENKNPKFELEPNRKVYFQLGLFIVGTVTLMAFSYKTPVYLEEKIEVEREVDVPIMLVEKDVKPIVKVPKVETLPIETNSTPILSPDLLNNIKKTKSRNVDEKNVVSDEKQKNITTGNFTVDPGFAPDLGVIVKYPDFDAQFYGSWTEFLGNELKYPEESRIFNESGTAWVSFVVEVDGSVTDVKVLNKNLAKPLQKEAIRVVKASPKWKPGTKNGERVRSTKKVKINFKIK